jgi:hypothetical protein
LTGDVTGGVARNERLTGTTAVVLLVLLAVESVTILFIRPLLSWHIFVGMLLIPTVALKLATTTYRMAHHYRGSLPYVLRGPPPFLLRALAPLVVVATVAVFGTGVALLALGPTRGHGLLLGVHRVSFFVWLGATGLHVLAHLKSLPRLVLARGLTRRIALVGVTVLAGAALAAGTYSHARQWFHWFDREAAHVGALT